MIYKCDGKYLLSIQNKSIGQSSDCLYFFKILIHIKQIFN